MDNQITERARGVDVRVQQALDSGAYAIDADDVRELLAALRYSQNVARGFDYQSMELTTQVLAVKAYAQELEAKLAAAMRKQRDTCASAANKIQWATPDYAHQEGVCPECGQYEHDGHSEDCMVGRACGIYDVLRLTGALQDEGAISDGWLPWLGGDMPAEAAGKLIDIEHRDGEISQSLSAESFRWDHLGVDGDVVFWRASKKARAGCPECGQQPGGGSACGTCAALQATGVMK